MPSYRRSPLSRTDWPGTSIRSSRASTPRPAGLAESRNSQIAALRFQARGYCDPEYFKLKTLPRCGMPHIPWARIVA